MSKKENTPKKTYVLDTSVILYDYNAINNFEENNVAIPINVLEELDNFKKGSDSKNFEAREFIRYVDKLSAVNPSLQEWIPMDEEGNKGNFKVVMNDFSSKIDAERVFNEKKQDHRILNAALKLKKEEKDKSVILVTKDINLRLKAKSLDLPAEDYETGKVRDINNLYTGKTLVENVAKEHISTIFEEGSIAADKVLNEFPEEDHYYILRNGSASTLAYFNPNEHTLESLKKQTTFGITPKNAEQTFAMHAILNPKVKLVTIQGVAGTGKTLLALAGSIEQRRKFKQIYLARPIVPLSNKDIGYLPGDINSKIDPYMQPLWDNLKFIKDQFPENDKRFKNIEEMVSSEKLLITPLAFIRGRTLSNIIFIV
ncbi:MAG: PhoH family protein, partial [Flavobacteriales bacterium]